MTQSFIVDNVGGISGSLTTLVDGTSYLVAGTGISVTSQSNGSVLVASSASSSPTMQSASFTSNGTWVSPITGIVTLLGFGGGGGGGGGYPGTGTGGGGGGGSLQASVVVSVMSGSSYAVTIGAGGSGGATSSAHDGGCGGDTSFDTLAVFGGASGGGGARIAGSAQYPGGGLCVTGFGGSLVTTADILSIQNSFTIVGFVNSVACGGWSVEYNSGYGMRNNVGGFDAGNGGASTGTYGGGGGGGAGTLGTGGNGGNGGTSTAGVSGGANTGAGGGGGGALSGAGGNGGAGGSGMLTIVFFA